jgi:tetratricopeptide (TPR) repeat protein
MGLLFVHSIRLAAAAAAAFAQAELPAQSAAAREQGLVRPVPTPDPARVVSPEMRGDILMARKMYREAADAYRSVSQTSAVLINKTGIAYHQMMDLRTAQKYYEKAVKANPKYAEAWNNLGAVHYGQKRYKRAIGMYRKALEIAPNSASVHSNLGTAHFARKEYDRAIACYQRALELDPEIFEHRGTHGVMLQERSVAERAVFHYHLAKLYAKAGQTERALLYMRKSIEEGFKDRKKFAEDAEFAALRELPEFQELLKLEVKIL